MIPLLLALTFDSLALDRPEMVEPAEGQCTSAKTLMPGESRGCIGTSLPPNYAAHLLADNYWLDNELSKSLAQLDGKDAVIDWQAETIDSLQKKQCSSLCVGGLTSGGIVVGGGLVVLVVYALAPAFGG